MKAYALDPNALLGGVIAEDADQQITHLHLQKNNEMPQYETDAITTLIAISGKARVQTAENFVDVEPLQIVRIEPHENHTVIALADNTHLVAIKQLCHQSSISKQLRFGKCCL